MEKKSFEELSRMIEDAEERVKIGGIYSHYKNRENTYRVESILVIQEPQSIGVVYKALYDDHENVKFVRPYEEFTEQVEVDGEMVDRFQLVN